MSLIVAGGMTAGWARKLLRGIAALRPVAAPRLSIFHSALRFPRSLLLNGKGSPSRHRPDCFGPFRVRADLGASRFGPVYLGRDPSTNTRVVIRTFELSKKWREFGEQSDLLDSFRKICETTLDHPGLARPLACGAEGDIPYLVYSDLPGTAMDAVMRQDGVRPVAEVLQRTRELADAIDCAASAGVHHGMMAPCDVFLEGERTGVTGFGLAQALIKVGIPAEAQSPYGSPQRLAGAPPTTADDIYSLAAITLELLIGTPTDPEEDTKRVLREQGLPERRRIQRPAAHETRAFTTIAGVDAGKLRAAFAAAFSDEPSERPSTASEFVASFQAAISNRRRTDESAPSVVAVPFVRDEPEEPPSAPALDITRAGDGESVAPPPRQEDVATERRETPATSQLLIRESQEHAPREGIPERRVARPAPIVADSLLAEVTPPRASSTRTLLVAAVITVTFAAGFGGGFMVGQRSRPSTESIDISNSESVSKPQPPRAAVKDSEPIASTTRKVVPISEEKGSSSEPIAATVAPQPAVPAVVAGRLLVRSTPAGAGVVVDGRSRGVTPLDLRELAFGTYTVKVSHPGHDTRQSRVTLSERRQARSLDFKLRPASVPLPLPATPTSNSPGSLLVTSNPLGAQVFVDDSLVATTPFLLSNVAAGMRHLRIELSGYKIWTTSVQIEPSARSRVSVSLEPLEP